MRTHHHLNELYILFPFDYLGSSLENFPNAGIVVPVSTFYYTYKVVSHFKPFIYVMRFHPRAMWGIESVLLYLQSSESL
jgi:hypothetical protein